MAGRDHDAHIRPHFASKKRDRRRGQGAGHNDIDANTRESGDQRVFHHISGQASVFSDDDAMSVFSAGEVGACGLCDAHDHRRGDRPLVRSSPNAVCAEELSSHLLCISALFACYPCSNICHSPLAWLSREGKSRDDII